jgi:hypothetical protein
VPNADLTLTEDASHPGQWRSTCAARTGRRSSRSAAAQGTSPQFVREQVFQQFAS